MKLFNFIILLFSFLFSFNANCQNLNQKTTDSNSCFQEKDTVYWFYIKIEWNARIKEYNLSVKSPILSGSLEKYDRSLWRKLQGRKLLAVGPFGSEIEAIISKNIYYSVSKDINFDDSKSSKNLYWCKMKFTISKRKGRFMLKIIPEVYTGTCFDFYNDMKQAMKENEMLFGLYKDYECVKEMIEPRKTNCGM